MVQFMVQLVGAMEQPFGVCQVSPFRGDEPAIMEELSHLNTGSGLLFKRGAFVEQFAGYVDVMTVESEEGEEVQGSGGKSRTTLFFSLAASFA